MKEDILELRKEFLKIKKMGLVKSLRSGTTGIGYTFESLIGKKEDSESKPDYKSIEIKCKLGFTKAPITLFNCAPKRNGEFATRYIYETYGHVRYNNPLDIKLFQRTIYANLSKERYGYSFKLKVDYYKTRVIMLAYYNDEFIEEVCYWDFKDLELKLRKKLTTLAIVTGYPYKRDNIKYYKYMKIEFYRLRGFLEFLELINHDKISISFYIKEGKNDFDNPTIISSGIRFCLKKDYLLELFYKLNF